MGGYFVNIDPQSITGEPMATHSSTFAWRIPWMEESGGLQSMGLQRVRHNRCNLAAAVVYNLNSLHFLFYNIAHFGYIKFTNMLPEFHRFFSLFFFLSSSLFFEGHVQRFPLTHFPMLHICQLPAFPTRVICWQHLMTLHWHIMSTKLHSLP